MMFAGKKIVTGLDVGTSQVTAVVAEVGESDADMPRILGIGQAKSRGVRKGEIVDADLTTEDVRRALAQAEQSADQEIRSVHLGVSGGHLRSFINRGAHPIVSAERDIAKEDVMDVVKNAKAVNLPNEHYIIHTVQQHFSVDGHSGILNPVGLAGAKIEVDLLVVHGKTNRLKNSIQVVKNLRIEVEEIVFSGLACALAVLNSQQKELGTLVLDFGGGTIEYVVYYNGLVRHTGVLPVGGDHISNDLAYGFKVPLGRAEQLKIQHGSALNGRHLPNQTITIPDLVNQPDKTIHTEHLRHIMSLRVSECLDLIEKELEEAGCRNMVQSGVVITGGGARIPDLIRRVEHVFGVPALVGVAGSVNAPADILEQPEFAAGIGLAKFGIFELRKQRERKMKPLKWGRAFRQWWQRI